jgi:hypothetical protein
MLGTNGWTTKLSYRRPRCARCGDTPIAALWSEHVTDRCVRHLWSCEACGYEFETTYLRSRVSAIA